MSNRVLRSAITVVVAVAAARLAVEEILGSVLGAEWHRRCDTEPWGDFYRRCRQSRLIGLEEIDDFLKEVLSFLNSDKARKGPIASWAIDPLVVDINRVVGFVRAAVIAAQTAVILQARIAWTPKFGPSNTCETTADVLDQIGRALELVPDAEEAFVSEFRSRVALIEHPVATV